MSSIEKKALHLIELIYATALDKRLWPSLIGAISDSVDGQGGMLRLTDYANQKVGIFETVGYEPGFAQAYRDHFINIDPYRNFFESAPVGILIAATQLQNYASVLSSEFQNDYIRPQDREFLSGATLARDGNVTIQLGLHRGKRTGDFEEEDLQLLHLLLPHLTQSVHVHRLIGESTNRADMAFASLDQARIGIFLMNANGKILHINREGEKFLATGDLAVKQKKLALTNPNSTARLLQLIASAAQPSLGKSLECGGELRIFSAEGKIRLELRVIPLSMRDAMAYDSAPLGCAAVFVSRPGTLRLPWQNVASTYGLTPAESKLAVMLAEGCRAEEAAERLHVSLNTVRTQLKSVFAKTGVRRQPELVAMLLSGLLSWCNAEEEKE